MPDRSLVLSLKEFVAGNPTFPPPAAVPHLLPQSEAADMTAPSPGHHHTRSWTTIKHPVEPATSASLPLSSSIKLSLAPAD